MRNIIRIGAGTDRRNRFVAIALGVALAVGPAAMLPAAALAAPATDAAAASTTAQAIAAPASQDISMDVRKIHASNFFDLSRPSMGPNTSPGTTAKAADIAAATTTPPSF